MAVGPDPMADNCDEKAVPRRSGREQGAQQVPVGLDTGGPSEASCPSAELAVRFRVRSLDGPAGLALAARQGQALLRAFAALEKLDKEGR